MGWRWVFLLAMFPITAVWLLSFCILPKDDDMSRAELRTRMKTFDTKGTILFIVCCDPAALPADLYAYADATFGLEETLGDAMAAMPPRDFERLRRRLRIQTQLLSQLRHPLRAAAAIEHPHPVGPLPSPP